MNYLRIKKFVIAISMAGIILLISGCQPESSLTVHNIDEKMLISCIKTPYAKGQIIELPDISLEFIGEREVNVQNVRTFIYYDFKIKRGAEEKLVSWTSGTGDIGPSSFEIGGKKYTLEKGISERLGNIESNEVVICPMEEKNSLTASNMSEELTLNRAIEISKNELHQRGYKIEDMRVEADDINSLWKEFSTAPGTTTLQSPHIVRMELEKKAYWAIYFTPKKLMLGGDAWVFIDKNNGKIIGTLFGQ